MEEKLTKKQRKHIADMHRYYTVLFNDLGEEVPVAYHAICKGVTERYLLVEHIWEGEPKMLEVDLLDINTDIYNYGQI